MTPQKSPPIQVDKKLLKEAFNNDPDLMIFYGKWLDNGRDATKAYQEMHPEVTRGSAAVLGSRLLKKVNRDYVLDAFGLTESLYYTQLVEGNKAQKWNDFTGEREADHKTRKPYHDKLGKLLGIEDDKALVTIDQRTLVINDGSEE